MHWSISLIILLHICAKGKKQSKMTSPIGCLIMQWRLTPASYIVQIASLFHQPENRLFWKTIKAQCIVFSKGIIRIDITTLKYFLKLLQIALCYGSTKIINQCFSLIPLFNNRLLDCCLCILFLRRLLSIFLTHCFQEASYPHRSLPFLHPYSIYNSSIPYDEAIFSIFPYLPQAFYSSPFFFFIKKRLPIA